MLLQGFGLGEGHARYHDLRDRGKFRSGLCNREIYWTRVRVLVIQFRRVIGFAPDLREI